MQLVVLKKRKVLLVSSLQRNTAASPLKRKSQLTFPHLGASSQGLKGNQTAFDLLLAERSQISSLLKAGLFLPTPDIWDGPPNNSASPLLRFSSLVYCTYTHRSTLKLLIQVTRLKTNFAMTTASLKGLSNFSVLASLQVMISDHLCTSLLYPSSKAKGLKKAFLFSS